MQAWLTGSLAPWRTMADSQPHASTVSLRAAAAAAASKLVADQ